MIERPRRSVTRFFIPMIDVLTLLFCMFLLLPMVQIVETGQDRSMRPDSTASTLPEETRDGKPPDLTDPLGEDLRAQERLLEQLRGEQIAVLQERLLIRVLEINPEDGKLYYQDAEGRREIGSQAEAQQLITELRTSAPGREVYFLFLFPRRVTGFPQEKQVRQYERWFSGVAHGFDNPHGLR